MSIRNLDDELKIEITPRLSRLPGLFESVENFGSDNNVPEANVYVINLILDELITNYVTHSVGLVERPKINVTVKFDDDGLVLVFEDSGPLFDPTVVGIGSDSPQPREADGGGVGLHLIRSYADQIQYTALGGRNRIVFRCGVDQGSEGTER